MATDPNTAAAIRNLSGHVQGLLARSKMLEDRYTQVVNALNAQPQSITAEIDSISGRRLYYNLVGNQTFTAAQDGVRGAPISMLVSQDGSFIQTHYPVVAWKPNAPENATNFGRWRPIYSWPLPTQELGTDSIDISYEITDSGSQRNFQNAKAPPALSRFDLLMPLPVPTLFAPNTTVSFIPTYERIIFDTQPGEGITTTAGELVVLLPGYKIANM